MSAGNGYDWAVKLDAIAEQLNTHAEQFDIHAGDMRSRVAYLEAGLPRIEQVWKELTLAKVELTRLDNTMRDFRDKVHHLIGVTSHRFDLLNDRITRSDKMIERLLVAAGLEVPK